MKKVLIVDDDTIVRITLRTMIDWEKYGFELEEEDASNGEQALDILRAGQVDLMIVDMKMPIMDGLQLLEKVREEGIPLCSVVLSSYDDFHMVREAFRLGARDYLLKGDINEEVLGKLLEKLLSQQAFQEREKEPDGLQIEKKAKERRTKESRLADMATGREEPGGGLIQGPYYIVMFEIDDFSHHAARFGGELETGLVQPFLEFARQIPRVAAKSVIISLSPSRYLMYCHTVEGQEGADMVVSTCRQLKNVWSNFMNLPVSAGISFCGKSEADFFACLEEAGRILDYRYLCGRACISYPWKKEILNRELEKETAETYKELTAGLLSADEMKTEEEKGKFFQAISAGHLEDGRRKCISLLLFIARELRENYMDLWSLFPEEVNYYEKLERLDQSRSLELWMNNFFRWIMDYMIHAGDNRQSDLMSRAKRFIQDNYSNPELTLGSVASFVELNEKYFSSRFTREVGNTFSNYVTEVRIRKAKELMDNTNMKMYEISQQVGYNNVEHFTRVFKKVCKISPSAYKRSET